MLKSTTNVKTQTSPPIGANLAGLWRICFPLMLSALSGTLMTFFARTILAQYDTQAMIAATTACSILLVFQFGAMSVALIAEIFVGQYNGARQWKKVCRPVWQMIWFSLGTSFIMIPVGLWGANWFIAPEFAVEGGAYFKWLMIFGPVFPLVSALSSFFVGRGEVKVVMLSVILGNIINFILVVAFVYGIPNLIQPLGAKGAALATGIAETCIAVGLFCIFLNAENRKKYHSHHWNFDLRLFMHCIKIGFPNAAGHMISIAAWAMMMRFLTDKSVEHVTVMSIVLTIWALFSFITEGLQKGISTVASNCIGARDNKCISKVFSLGLQLQILLAIVLAVPLIITPELLVGCFLPAQENAVLYNQDLNALVELSCRWLWVAYLFEGMTWVIDGVLTAAGDTAFIMLMNSLGTWILCIAPIYYFIVMQDGSPSLMLQWIATYCLLVFICYLLRYKSKRWQKNACFI